MGTYTDIKIDEVRDLLKVDKGWVENENVGVNEYVFDWAVSSKPGEIVRVYSSVSKCNGKGRGCGRDAIRVCAFRSDTDRGLVRSRRVHRVAGWRDNLRSRVMDVLKLAKVRADWK